MNCTKPLLFECVVLLFRRLPSTTFCSFTNEKKLFQEMISEDRISLDPPLEVSGMKVLNREAFKKTVSVPSIIVQRQKLKEAVKHLKPVFLKMPKLYPVVGEGDSKTILLNPDLFNEKHTYLQNVISKLNLGDIEWEEVDLTYENWSSDHIFKAVLPPDSTGNVSGFSIIGHIIHLNLKPDLMEYKYLIGQVLLDKCVPISTVVNKIHTIENEFRNFTMELLAGEPNYEVLVKENYCSYKFDFSKVFWNPRLIHEHTEIVKKVDADDIVFDVFAGVGPFAVPLAKKKCCVYANDLNPDSYHYLCENAKLNKVSQYVHSYNLDGRDFIQSVVKVNLVKLLGDNHVRKCVHILMNLPACALEFIQHFKGLLSKTNVEKSDTLSIVIYCYFFLKKDENIFDILGEYFDEKLLKTLQITKVRLVAPNKTMMRVVYNIKQSVLFQIDDTGEPSTKRIRHN